MKFRRRMIGTITAITVGTLGLAFAVVSHVVNASQERQLDEALLAEARQEAGEAAQIGGHELAISSGPGPSADDVGPLTKYGAIFDERGKVVAATPTFNGHPPRFESVRHPPETCFNTWFGREHLRAVLEPVPGYPGTLLMLAAPRLDLDGDATFLKRAMLLALLAALAWTGLILSWVVRRLTRGHEAIALAARRVADGDFSARVGAPAGDEEVAQLGRDVDHMIDRLSTLVTAQQEFIVHAAHELRSPLTTLYGELSHALRRSRDGEAYRRAIEESLDSARRLKELAEDLLALARVGASTEAPAEIIDPRNLVERAARTVSGEAAARGVDVVIGGDSTPVSGRPHDLERLFRNLLENAIRHSPAGGRVDVRVARQNGAAVVSVSDEGAGVAEQDRERIFEPFYRGPRESVDDLSGAGLGLAIARKIARSHGGDLELAQRRGPGAEFVVRLPS
ncbi:MAG TPA: HAMP domain-containing sensor histidine kinase [Polyangia bacterium]|nr:HAMP domain-containing sensor histidine kinase [Polyangia bacterium]